MARSPSVSAALQSTEGGSGSFSGDSEKRGELARSTSASGVQLFGDGAHEEGFVSARVSGK